MEKTKKKLTIKQKQKRYNTLSKVCLGGQYLSIITPFIILGAVNFESWFMNDSGWRVGVGGAIALALMSIATALITKKKEDESKITNGYIYLVITWYAIGFILVLLESVLHDIAQIMFIGGTGLLGALGLNIEGNILKEKSNTLKEIIGETEKDAFREQAKKEYEAEQKANDKDYGNGTSI